MNGAVNKLKEDKTDADDNEVQEIFSKNVGNVEEVLVEVTSSNSVKNEEQGRISSLLHDLRKPSPSGSSTASTSPWPSCKLTTTMNGHHSDGDMSGFSSDDEHRYPPQMVLTPIPGASPLHTEDNNNNFEDEFGRPPVPLSRFSFEENIHAPFLKPPSTAAVLAPLRPKKVPEHLRLDVGYTSAPSVKTFEFKPVTSPSTEPTLAPLKITKVKQPSPPTKQQGLPLMQQPVQNRQIVMSPTKTSRGVSGGSANNGERNDSADFSKFWARKKKPEPIKASSSSSRCKQMNRSLSIPEETRPGSKGASGFSYGSEFRQLDSDSEFSRKLKDKQTASFAGGQILPAISNDKPNKVSQVQGTFRDQIARFRRSVKKKPKNKSCISSMDEGYEENSRPNKPKEKKKIRKVMSWNT